MRRESPDYIRILDDYLADIRRYIAENGPKTYNLIQLTLRQIDREFGEDAARKAIKDYQLAKRYGIKPKRNRSSRWYSVTKI